MAKFFIDRPIFAWVIALFIIVMGSVAITQLPIAQYPPVAPPSIVISATYPGASAKTLEESVLSIVEQEMNGSPGLIYMESVAQASGTGSITLSFQPGTNPDLAQVDVQNRLSRATPRLPSAVTQQGVRVDKARSNFLLFAILSSDDPALNPVALGDYASRSIVPELQRLPGVGQVQLFGTERAMRIWIDPAKLLGYNLSASDVTAAIRAQNAQVSAGEIGSLPNVAGQGIAATVVVGGQLSSVAQFGNVVRAPERCGAHRTGCPGLRHLSPAQRQTIHRHRRTALAQRQRAGHSQSGTRAHARTGNVFPQRHDLGDSLRQFAFH
jgi:multidrug efflux pump